MGLYQVSLNTQAVTNTNSTKPPSLDPGLQLATLGQEAQEASGGLWRSKSHFFEKISILSIKIFEIFLRIFFLYTVPCPIFDVKNAFGT